MENIVLEKITEAEFNSIIEIFGKDFFDINEKVRKISKSHSITSTKNGLRINSKLLFFYQGLPVYTDAAIVIEYNSKMIKNLHVDKDGFYLQWHKGIPIIDNLKLLNSFMSSEQYYIKQVGVPEKIPGDRIEWILSDNMVVMRFNYEQGNIVLDETHQKMISTSPQKNETDIGSISKRTPDEPHIKDDSLTDKLSLNTLELYEKYNLSELDIPFPKKWILRYAKFRRGEIDKDDESNSLYGADIIYSLLINPQEEVREYMKRNGFDIKEMDKKYLIDIFGEYNDDRTFSLLEISALTGIKKENLSVFFNYQKKKNPINFHKGSHGEGIRVYGRDLLYISTYQRTFKYKISQAIWKMLKMLGNNEFKIHT